MVFSLILHVAVFYGLLACAQTTLQIPFVPLAVKTPYLNAWYSNSDSTISPAVNWPQFFTNDKILGWAGIVRVDGKAYQWLGSPLGLSGNKTKTVMSTITPTKSIFRIEAGPVQFNATFFSPIEPSDYVRQSIPFTYLYIDGFSVTDSSSHNVQVYSDITAEWAARDITTLVKWDAYQDDTMIYHHVTRQEPDPLDDDKDFAEDSDVYYATLKRSGFTFRAGSSVMCRKIFVQNGTLDDKQDTNYRAINADDWPAFSYAVDLGTMTSGSQPDPVLWAIGLVRDPLLSYPSIPRSQTGFYWLTYSNITNVVSAFLGDFQGARDRSSSFDNKIMSAASQISSEYADILSIVTRQIFASMDFTVTRAQNGALDPTPRIFMKDMGVSTRTNPVDVLYGALPAFLYFNATLVRDLLEPLLELQTSSPYAAPDLGSTYPTVFANTSDTHTLAIDATGSMLVIAYAHALKSGDGSLISRYYSTLQRWADFLLTNAMNAPQDTITMDGLPGVKSTNLALKSILGIYSMAKINEAVGSSNTSFMTLTQQAQFYLQENGALSGLSLDSTLPDIIYPHWSLLTAATIPDTLNTVRNQLIHQVHQRAYNNTKPWTLPKTYSADTGNLVSSSGSASAIFGASYGLLALSLPNHDIQAEQVGSNSGKSKQSRVNTIVEGVIGGVACLVLILFGLSFWRRHRKSKQAKAYRERQYTRPRPFASTTGSSPGTVQNGISSPRTRQQLSSPSPTISSFEPLRYLALPSMSKHREAPGHHPMPSASAVSDLTNTNSASATGTEELRVEVAQLRQELESMRRLTDLPPGYA
ncbi:hypothetical protein NP233_g5446 [Leucocoprinus birnbaumii]|uniref:DUF1793-domain-containing protein n=1 Tax=Leucocoprinus birnbaumii TaxID=56174 RepID=A0AAD5VV84_9AGAR|nr:hypothetical protein NP233_g5446 [Leucocoprinus birnbaumii]